LGLWRVKSVTQVLDELYWHPDGGYAFFCRPSVSRVADAEMFMDRSTPLLKLHGSINWRPILGARRPYISDAIVHHEPWLPTPPQAHGFNVDAIESLLEPEPFIVPPVLLKSVLTEEPILKFVWSEAATRMRNATSVTFVGYSMREVRAPGGAFVRTATTRLHDDRRGRRRQGEERPPREQPRREQARGITASPNALAWYRVSS
jgi:hypothetical protein